MSIRSVALFAHIVGMMGLFVGLSFEWLSIEFLRRPMTPAQRSPWVSVLTALPQYVATAIGMVLTSGIYLAARVGVFDFAWVRVSFGAMVLMAVAGGPLVRSQMRAVQQSAGDDRDGRSASRHASHLLLRASLHSLLAVALTIVYLMIAKPEVAASLLLIGGALVVGVATSLPGRRVQSS
jgi:hypothetical protein